MVATESTTYHAGPVNYDGTTDKHSSRTEEGGAGGGEREREIRTTRSPCDNGAK